MSNKNNIDYKKYGLSTKKNIASIIENSNSSSMIKFIELLDGKKVRKSIKGGFRKHIKKRSHKHGSRGTHIHKHKHLGDARKKHKHKLYKTGFFGFLLFFRILDLL